ncbi:MAG: hypothetical protein JRH10_08460 [Deltaproteobacteria bacterium]|nr:hypothetical protein [Deltaproteobacteria bacterium]MBW2444352.1 hypothetical protein [Deltaproteobacteria bacterium]
MEFWSKGLGKKTINLSLAKGESLPSEGTVCLRGTMEEPVSWEYIMKLTGDDIIDFFALLKGPTMADYLFDSPHRWQLYKSMVVGGIRLGVLLVVAAARRILGREVEMQEVSIEVPPPSVRKKKTAKKTKQRPLRRRLSAHSTEAPAMSSTVLRDRTAETLAAGPASE